ncbi:hypothetical protein V8E54_014052 [Elaphomyces granulatus]
MKILLFLFATLLADLVGGRVINDNLIRSPMTCNNFAWTNSLRDIRAAAEAARDHRNAGTTVGPNPQNQYPKGFSNHEGLGLAPGCAGNPLFEYPLKNLIPYQNLTDPGLYRVVVNFIAAPPTDVRLCTVMFHRSSDANFANCPWRTDVLIDHDRLRRQQP